MKPKMEIFSEITKQELLLFSHKLMELGTRLHHYIEDGEITEFMSVSLRKDLEKMREEISGHEGYFYSEVSK